MTTPSSEDLADIIRDCVQSYVNANQGSGEHPLGKAVLNNITAVLPHLKNAPSVKGGFAISFEDGTTFLVNVHQMPGTVPLQASESSSKSG